MTFGYWYCDKCKKEPGVDKKDNLEVPKTWNPWRTTPPTGYVALKGDKVICSDCCIEVGELVSDLVAKANRIYLPIDYKPGLQQHHPGCNGSTTKYDVAARCIEVHIQGRGWV